jgi:hypothetical protein
MDERLIDTFPENMSRSSWFRRTFCVHTYCEAENKVRSDAYKRMAEAWEAGKNGELPPGPPPNQLFCKGIG